MIESQDRLPKSLFYTTFILTVIAWLTAAVLLVVMGVSGYHGLDGGAPITITSCSNTYLTTKFDNQSLMLRTSFLGILATVVCFSVVLIVMIVWLYRVCQGALPQVGQSRNVKMLLYLLSNIALVCSIPCFGYFLAFYRQTTGCQVSSSENVRVFLFTFMTINIVLAFVLWILFLTIWSKDQTQGQEKYREVVSYPTEPAQLAKTKQEPMRPVEETRQNIYTSPQKRPETVYYNKESEQKQKHIQQLNVFYNKEPEKAFYNKQPEKLYYNKEAEQRQKTPSPVYEKQRQPVVLEPAQQRYHPSMNSRVSKVSRAEEVSKKDSQFRSRSKYEQSEDNQSFQNVQRNYLQNNKAATYMNPLRRKDQSSDGELKFFKPRERAEMDPFKNETGGSNRQGVLLNRIRGKYANY